MGHFTVTAKITTKTLRLLNRAGPKGVFAKGISMKTSHFLNFKAFFTVVSKRYFQKSPRSWIPLLGNFLWSLPIKYKLIGTIHFFIIARQSLYKKQDRRVQEFGTSTWTHPPTYPGESLPSVLHMPADNPIWNPGKLPEMPCLTPRERPPPPYIGKMGSICHFPRALSASIWVSIVKESLWRGFSKKGVTNFPGAVTNFLLVFVGTVTSETGSLEPKTSHNASFWAQNARKNNCTTHSGKCLELVFMHNLPFVTETFKQC